MRERMPLVISVVLNVFLGLALVTVYRMGIERELLVPTASPRPTAPEVLVKTNTIVRRLNFTWQQLESGDYTAYIRNLREIGCPEQTIRDIIIADVNQLYAQKRYTEVISPDVQWWESDPDPQIARTAAAKFHALEDERQQLLTRLLGPDWELIAIRNSPDTPMVGLNDPILGGLSSDAKQEVQSIYARAALKSRALLDEGLTEHSAEMISLRLQTREALAKLLSPEQMEEYLLRYSQNASHLRDELRGLRATPDEFRSIFRAVDDLDLRIDALNASDGNHTNDLAKLIAQRNDAVKGALKPERFQAYQTNRDPLYQDARSLVAQTGASSDVLEPLYKINQATAEEQTRIITDSLLSEDERDEQLKEMRDVQDRTLRQLLGAEAFEKYLRTKK